MSRAHVYGAEAPEVFTVLENGVAIKYFKNVDGLRTWGFLLDQYEVRASLIDGLAWEKLVKYVFLHSQAVCCSCYGSVC